LTCPRRSQPSGVTSITSEVTRDAPRAGSLHQTRLNTRLGGADCAAVPVAGPAPPDVAHCRRDQPPWASSCLIRSGARLDLRAGRNYDRYAVAVGTASRSGRHDRPGRLGLLPAEECKSARRLTPGERRAGLVVRRPVGPAAGARRRCRRWWKHTDGSPRHSRSLRGREPATRSRRSIPGTTPCRECWMSPNRPLGGRFCFPGLCAWRRSRGRRPGPGETRRAS